MTSTKYKIQNIKILEWRGYENIEAWIKAEVVNDLLNGIGFYPIDYFLNKSKYLNSKILNINIGGICYIVQEVDLTNTKYSQDFTGYLNYKNKIDEFQFIGDILDYNKTVVNGKSCYILKIKIVGYEKKEDSFIFDLFVNEENLNIKLEKGSKVSGLFWMFGYIN